MSGLDFKDPLLQMNYGTAHFTASSTFSPPFKCRALVTVIGGGGSGAAYRTGTNSSECCVACGGGAGGTAISLLTLDPSVTYTVTVGAGGVRRGYSAVNAGLDGLSGGNSVFSGTGISTMTGTGGSGGAGDFDGSAAATADGGAGGVPTGGNLANNTGGAGGDMTNSSTQAGKMMSSGGGAPGLLNSTGWKAESYDSGFETTTGGDQQGTGAGQTSEDSLATAGMFDAKNSDLPISAYGLGSSILGACTGTSNVDSIYFLPNIGAGAIGHSNVAIGYPGGWFAGGGGNTSNGIVMTYGSDGGMGGGGGGGTCGKLATALQIYSGKGGDGWVFIEILGIVE